jgi:energy-coupling factor transporter ATP-binding protein EcfA2
MESQHQIKCGHCGELFAPRTEWQKFCKKICNRRAYRSRKGLPEPDFPSMKVDSYVEKERQVRKAEDRRLFELVEQLKELDKERQQRETECSQSVEWKIEQKGFGNNKLIGITGMVAEVILGGVSYFDRDNQNLRKTVSGISDGNRNIMSEIGIEAENHFRSRLNDTLREIAKVKNDIVEIHHYREIRQSKTNLDTIRQQLGDSRIFKKIQKEVPIIEVLDYEDNVSAIALNDLLNYQFDSIEITGYEYMGKIERGAIIMLHGGAGSGKSTFALKIVNAYMASGHGKALYASAEEMKVINGVEVPSQTLVERIKRHNITQNIIFTSSKTLGAMIKKAKDNNCGFVVIDSLTVTEMTTEDVKKLIHLCPGTIFLFILQHTKQGQYKGDAELNHLSDMTIKAENMTIESVKNRYGSFKSVKI